ncbi:hypothetical protein GCM10010910_26550 [Microbacterium nanhaiense]|uniref:Uncharacterized protein n=1 Tax=Microbacterium nanhaiense TaxID=1301026 RepID=A0ABQ2N5V0_9MICO|nr:hypothetical protein GCM10010910_26550 [Microbacterium nanhaiense]
MLAGYGEAPYGLGPYGGGWLWQPCPTKRTGYEESQRLYDEHVVWQPLIAPLRDAPPLIAELYKVRLSAS